MASLVAPLLHELRHKQGREQQLEPQQVRPLQEIQVVAGLFLQLQMTRRERGRRKRKRKRKKIRN
jgi:hypothetical protein